MTIETDEDLQALKKIGWIVGTVLQKMMAHAEPGMKTAELDAFGGQLLEQYGARSAPALMYDFPGFTCISINEEMAHGIPGERQIGAGDIVNIDVSAELNGYFADTGGSFVVPPVAAHKQKLLHATRQALMAAIDKARAGAPLNAIGKAVSKVAKQHHYKIVKNLCSHGVGRSLHEEPKEIPTYFDPRDKRKLHEGLVITIEPFLSTRSQFASESEDGWTLVGAPGNLSAQFEHTMLITRGRPLLLTQVI